MCFALESAYRKMVRFAYTSFDRIVLRGHDRAVQAPAGFVWWCRSLRPDEPITDRYRPTAEGLRVAVLMSKLRDQLLHPLLASIHRDRRPSKPRRPLTDPDSIHLRISQGLFDLCEHLALRPAA